MDFIVGIGPLLLLIICVAWIVIRGMRSDIHDRDTGGGDIVDGD